MEEGHCEAGDSDIREDQISIPQHYRGWKVIRLHQVTTAERRHEVFSSPATLNFHSLTRGLQVLNFFQVKGDISTALLKAR